MAGLQFDEAGARHIDRTYATPDVVAQRATVLELLASEPGERIVDVGSGTGYLLASIADAVGPAGAAHGVDPSAAMNALAVARTADRPWVQVHPEPRPGPAAGGRFARCGRLHTGLRVRPRRTGRARRAAPGAATRSRLRR